MSKFCTDCKHIAIPEAHGSERFVYARCGFKPVPDVVDLVSGLTKKSGLPYCDIERASSGEGRCGVEGRNFEPNE